MPERRSTSSYKDSSSEEHNVRPSDVKAQNRKSLSRRQSEENFTIRIRERRRSSIKARKSFERKTREIEKDPQISSQSDRAQSNEQDLPSQAIPIGRIGRVSNSLVLPQERTPHEWVRDEVTINLSFRHFSSQTKYYF